MRVIPTLHSTGWAKTVPERIDRIFAYYYATNPSQTLRYRGEVVSFQSALQQAGDSLDRFVELINRDLRKVFQRNFPEGADVTVTAVPLDTDARYEIRVAAMVTEGGRQYDASRVLPAIDSIYRKSQAVTLQPNG